MAKYLPSGLRGSLIANGFSASDLTREFVIPAAVLSATTFGVSNLASAVLSHKLERQGAAAAEVACISVDKPTLIKSGEIAGHCTQSPEDVKALMETAMGIHSNLSQVLVEACGFEAVTVDTRTNRVRGMDMSLKAPHFIQYPDNSWSVTVDGFAELSADENLDGETFEAGSYVSFFQPKQATSMDCVDSAVSYVENASLGLYDPMEITCRTHLDDFGVYNGNTRGEAAGVLMPVVSCGMLGVSNPKDIESADKEDGHYSHTKTMSL